MKYAKPALTIEQQVEMLLGRGMLGDRAEMARQLAVVNYYRLSGYWFHRKGPQDQFQSGTRFEVVWKQYSFDRKLRLLVMDAVERIEVALRTQFSYHHTLAHGPFGYADDPSTLPKFDGRPEERRKALERVNEEVKRSKEVFVHHFGHKYGQEHRNLPLWMASEVMSFGGLLNLWQASSKQVKNAVAARFGISDEVLRTWLWSLNEVRNIVAHHGRLWNRVLGNKPAIPRANRHPEWHSPVSISNDRLFAVLCVCAHCLSHIASDSTWCLRVRQLLERSPETPCKNMGFPENWLESPLWKSARHVP